MSICSQFSVTIVSNMGVRRTSVYLKDTTIRLIWSNRVGDSGGEINIR